MLHLLSRFTTSHIPTDARNLNSPLNAIPGVGPTRAKALADLNLHTLGDLLEYFPRTYQYESGEKKIADLVHDQIQFARGEVVAVDYISHGRARFEATIDDGTGQLSLVWFGGAWLRNRIHPGESIRVQGNVKNFRGLPQMSQAKWELVDPETKTVDESKFRAIYPATLKLPSETIEKLVRTELPPLLAGIDEWFSPDLLRRRGMIGRSNAYEQIHLPRNLTEAQAARRRLMYDELMLMQLGLGISKRLRQGRLTAPVLRLDKTLDERIRGRFPFTFTPAQQNAVWEIAKDLRSGQPMNRLLQGDVGSGKTAVALYAMLLAVANRMQAAILAPTEVLAEQHFLTLSRALAESKVNIELFTGRTKKASRKTMLKRLSDGEIHLAVGTQALIQKDIDFANLGLVVVDEQHRLGVNQRAVLKGKGLSPHYLVMTATPIPRTLALSYFADFDVSVIDELPPGRQPIHSRWLKSTQAGKAYDLIRDEAGRGMQSYIVLPQIDDDGVEESKSVLKEFERLSHGPLSGLRLAMLHGQMSAEEKQSTMLAFRDRKLDVLIVTTVIEVGIDVPTATVIVIDDADRFGLSQLHQLRGRVGRGSEPSHCVLISDATSETAQARLTAICDSTDGFAIAEMDLKLRGPGEFFGTRQHGLPEFKLADITAEIELLQTAKDDALAILQNDPDLKLREHVPLRRALTKQFGDSLQLAQVG